MTHTIKLTEEELDACLTGLHVLKNLGFLGEKRDKLVKAVIAKLEEEADE